MTQMNDAPYKISRGVGFEKNRFYVAARLSDGKLFSFPVTVANPVPPRTELEPLLVRLFLGAASQHTGEDVTMEKLIEWNKE